MKILNWIIKHSNQLISFTLAIAVIFIAMQQGRELANALKQVRLGWAFAGLGCYGLNYLLRALRLKIVMKDRISMWPEAVHAACLHGLATYMLPFRSGDFTLPVILSKASNSSFSDGARVLIEVRLLDLCALGLWILTAATFINVSIPTMIHWAWVIFGVGLSLLPLILKRVVKRGTKLQSQFWQRVFQWGLVASFSFKEILVSLAIWACVGACFFFTVQAIGLPLGLMEVWLLITIQLPLQLIPLQGVANAGNHEGGWIAGLALLGIPPEQGLHFALLSHALLMIYVLSLGPSAFSIKRSKKINISARGDG